jgi:hypothetical protein
MRYRIFFLRVKERELKFYAPCRKRFVSPGSDITDNSYTFSPTDLPTLLRWW